MVYKMQLAYEQEALIAPQFSLIALHFKKIDTEYILFFSNYAPT